MSSHQEAKARAKVMLQNHRRTIALAIREQTMHLAPAFQQIEAETGVQSVLSILDGMVACMDGRGRAEFLHLVLGIAQLRKLTGLDARDLVASSLCYLPVIRRVFVIRGEGSLAENLAAFDALESFALPLMAEICRGVMPDINEFADAETLSDGRARPDLTPVPFDLS